MLTINTALLGDDDDASAELPSIDPACVKLSQLFTVGNDGTGILYKAEPELIMEDEGEEVASL